jgi:hypothetical protein
MLVESTDLVTPSNAAYLAGLQLPRFQEQVAAGQIKPFVTIDGMRFYHRNEVLALRNFIATMAGRRPTNPLPRTQELF